MSIKLRLTSGSYNVRATEESSGRPAPSRGISCVVYFLDDTDHVFEMDKRSKAQRLLDKVFEHLELMERDYFCLQFYDTESEMHPQANAEPLGREYLRWVDPLKTLKKQIRAAPPYYFYFRVKFYVSDPSRLLGEYTRYHFFLQLKKDILEGRLQVPRSTAALLASYSAQSELGDYNSDEHKNNYVSEFRFIPKQTEDFERDVIKFHKTHRGQTPADAEFNYLDRAKRLEMYGVDLHQAKDQNNTDIQLGVTSAGLVVFQGGIKMNTFSWAKIIKISFKRKQFFIQLRRELNENVENLLGFNMTSYRSCKSLWKSCVEHHTFFRLHTPAPSKKMGLFSLGSKFRYSGRTEYQTIEDSKRRARVEKSFSRSPSKRFARRTVGGTTRAVIGEEKNVIDHRKNAPSRRPDSILPNSNSTPHIRQYESFNSHTTTSTFAARQRTPTADDDEGGFLAYREGSKRGSLASSNHSNAIPPAQYNSSTLPSNHSNTLTSNHSNHSKSSGVSSYPNNNGRPGYSSLGRHGDARSLPSNNTSAYSNGESDELIKKLYNGAVSNGSLDGLVTIRIQPDTDGRFGFNVKGGNDLDMPVIVSRVAPGTPADICIPRLNEGDQVLFINGRDISTHTHEQVVQYIRASRETHSGELVLVVRPNVYLGDEAGEEPDFQYIPDTHRISSSAHTGTWIPNLDPRGAHTDSLAGSLMVLQEALESGAALAQFDQLFRKKPGMTMNAAKMQENMAKNRYRDISPYDGTRVKLGVVSAGAPGAPGGASPHSNGSHGNDYINANHVNMEIPKSGIVNRYIAAQGPLPNTVTDFWQMAWEQQCRLVVMLTANQERGRTKCHQYWPRLYETMDLGRYQLSCLKEEDSSIFAFREFTLTNTESKEERHVIQMQYISWPDHGVPDDSSHFLDFVIRVRQNRAGMVEPTIVHCSAGIGRTGVLITMETAMCLIEANQPVIPLDIVRQMREQRAMLIQTPSQYKFVCEAILRVHNESIVKPSLEYS